MAKIKFKVNLENFMNMTIIPSSDNKEESYKEVLDVLEDWEEYSVYAVMIANNIRKALGIKEREIVEEAKAIINNLQNEEKPLPKLPKGTPKIDTSKVYSYKYKNGSNKTCTRCDGLVSFDDFNKETHPWPTHVSDKGQIIGDGSCPEFGG